MKIDCYDFANHQKCTCENFETKSIKSFEVILKTRIGEVLLTNDMIVYTRNGWRRLNRQIDNNYILLSCGDEILYSNGAFVAVDNIEYNEFKSIQYEHHVNVNPFHNYFYNDVLIHNDKYRHYGFGCRITTLESVSFPALTSIGTYGMSRTFSGCTQLTSVSFPSLTNIGSSGMFYTFNGCTNLVSISFPSLTSIITSGMYNTFYNCTGLTAIHFLASMSTDATFVSYVNQCGRSDVVVWDL